MSTPSRALPPSKSPVSTPRVPTPWTRRRRRRLAAVAGLVAAALALIVLVAPGPTPATYKIYVAEDAVLRVSHDDLERQAPLGTVPSDHLRLQVGGADVPLWIEDGGDGRFGPGDHLELIARHARGNSTRYDEHAQFEVYRLTVDPDQARPARLLPGDTAAPSSAEAQSEPVSATAPADRPSFERVQHFERDIVRARFRPRRDGETPPPWYWLRMSQLDAPFRLPIDLSAFDRDARRPATLRIQLRGWSQPRDLEDQPDHVVIARWNGKELGRATWEGQDASLLELEIPPPRIRTDDINQLELRVPKRSLADGNRLVDVVLLDWIELRYRHTGTVTEPQTTLHLANTETPPSSLALATADAQPLTVLSDHTRWQLRGGARVAVDASANAPAQLHAVRADGFATPAAIEVDRPSTLRAASNRADYVMIVHPFLRTELEPLAAFHRERGLEVAVIEVDDIYDEFNHGRSHPAAIREFLLHTLDHWTPPAPRFVLLAGDASWDTNPQADDSNYADWTYRPGEGRFFVKNDSTPYDTESPVGHRNLIPTWDFKGSQGHAASDIFFVVRDLEARQIEPEMAIGRFPVVTREELRGVVEKTLRYARAPEPGPWRQRTLWITNESQAFQRRSDRLAQPLEERGFEIERVYPSRDEADNARHQQELHRAFADGQLLVSFYGHGGRYIWRTGPPDLQKNHDLFTLDDLDRLEASERLPIVVSLSCYSAPFDHPTADSIGEKFLRLSGRGAVAVIAASWRNSPSVGFADHLITRLTQPGLTIGEALTEAKRETPSKVMAAMYNLLGDPALEPALPPAETLVASAADTETPAGSTAGASPAAGAAGR